MRWTVTSKSAKQEIFELWHEDKKLMTLEYHPFTNSARIESADEKRVFLIRKEGFLRNKTVLRDEYGMRVGELSYEKFHSNEGTIELLDEKFSYRIENNPVTAFRIFRDDNKDTPFVKCGLKADKGNTSLEFEKENELSQSQHFLLMSLCWYMFLPVAKENMLEYAL